MEEPNWRGLQTFPITYEDLKWALKWSCLMNILQISNHKALQSG